MACSRRRATEDDARRGEAPVRRNVELKARDPDPARSLRAALALGAADHGELRQRDTYFHVPRGRLKLREQDPGSPHLIHYERADRAQERESRYRLVPIADARLVPHGYATLLGLGEPATPPGPAGCS